MDKTVYRRAVVKISGEALAGAQPGGIDFTVLQQIAGVLRGCLASGAQLAVVVGAGNFWRGAKNGGGRMDRTRADHMGMLATAMNALALADALEQEGVSARAMTAVEMPAFAEYYNPHRAREYMEEGRVVVLGCGTGNPFVSTDTAAVLRGLELGADVALLAKNIDGVYDRDPRTDPEAVKYDSLTFDEVLARHLGVIDATAASMAGENGLPLLLFALSEPENILRALTGGKVGTLIQNER